MWYDSFSGRTRFLHYIFFSSACSIAPVFPAPDQVFCGRRPRPPPPPSKAKRPLCHLSWTSPDSTTRLNGLINSTSFSSHTHTHTHFYACTNSACKEGHSRSGGWWWRWPRLRTRASSFSSLSSSSGACTHGAVVRAQCGTSSASAVERRRRVIGKHTGRACLHSA